jgi:hypothetical protein
MEYEIGEYGLTKGLVPGIMSDAKIHYLFYVDGTASGVIYKTYDEAIGVIKEKMRSDKETGRQDKHLQQGGIIIYFTAGWDDHSCQIIMHISSSYDKEILDLVHDYDDRIIVEQV